jgi:hypothetical protein
MKRIVHVVAVLHLHSLLGWWVGVGKGMGRWKVEFGRRVRGVDMLQELHGARGRRRGLLEVHVLEGMLHMKMGRTRVMRMELTLHVNRGDVMLRMRKMGFIEVDTIGPVKGIDGMVGDGRVWRRNKVGSRRHH